MGCAAFWHDLQPSRLNRLNRGPAPSLDPEFTENGSNRSFHLVRRIVTKKSPTVSVNSAEIAVVRAQSTK